jgi:hypothetical protein
VQPSPSEADDGSLDVGACSLCHCALDYSDRAAFFREDREVDYSSRSRSDGDVDVDDSNQDDDSTDEYYFRPDDPYLPIDLYDPNNALLYCDSCDRLYHQQCHFVPVLAVPRGAWHCMVCQTGSHTAKPSPRGKRAGGKRDSDNLGCDPSLLFTSPPRAGASNAERAWEVREAPAKAREVAQQVKKIRRYCLTQLGNCRLATAAVETLTSTQKNLHHFIFNNHRGGGGGRNAGRAARVSQELAQTVIKLTSSKYKLRRAILSVDEWRRGANAHRNRNRLGQLIGGDGANSGAAAPNNHEALRPPQVRSTYTKDFVSRVLFPFGRSWPIRAVPRTEEAGKHATDPCALEPGASSAAAGIPVEVVVSQSHHVDGGGSVGGRGQRQRAQHKHQQTKGNKRKKSSDPRHDGDAKERDGDDDDDDDGVSVDNLTCCICWQSTASDDNDLVLCDGNGCARAYHMNCVHPHLTQQDLEEDDWFCPICTCLADLLHLVQSETLGDEWEVRRRAKAAKRLPCDGSLKSWDGADDVFPTSEWEYETAQKLAKNQRDSDTNALLSQVLGFDEDALDADRAVGDGEDEDDDDSDDEHFDPVAHERETQKIRAREEGGDGDDADDSTRSSQLTLVEMSSVELNIGRDELAALSDEDFDDEDADGSGAQSARRSRRLAKKYDGDASSRNDEEEDDRPDDPGKLDESNILEGKRNRKPVDYRRLNDAMFGNLPDEENVMMDEGDDYMDRGTVASTSKKSTTSSSREDATDEDGGGSDDESENSSRSSTRKHRASRASKANGQGKTKKASLNDGKSRRRLNAASGRERTHARERATQLRTARNGLSRTPRSNGSSPSSKRRKAGATAAAASSTSFTVTNGIKRKRGASRSRSS